MQSLVLIRLSSLCWTVLACAALLLPPFTTTHAATGAAYLVKDIVTTTAQGDVVLRRKLGVLNNTLFFIGIDLLHGEEIWKTDGTPAGTSLVKDIAPGPKSGLATFVYEPACATPSAVVNNALFFIANQGTTDFELWKTDGTNGGTVRVASIENGGGYIGEDIGSCARMWTVKGLLILSTGRYYESALWRSDGTPAGTVSLGAFASKGLVINDTLFFISHYNSGLWRSDGTHAGTRKVFDLSSVGELTSIGSTLFFTTYEGLWKSDGTATGTVFLKNISSDENSSLIPLNGNVLFVANTINEGGVVLWRSDGTAAGTMLVQQIVSGTPNSDIHGVTAVGEMVFFRADDGIHGTELWKTDGTTAGTVVVKDIAPNGEMQAVGRTLFFGVDGAQQGLWTSDGTTDGTQRLLDRPVALLATAAGRLFFKVNAASDHRELWSSDGTVAGTVYLKDVLGGNQNDPPGVTEQNGIVFFSALNAQGVHVIWRGDGTPAGTTALTDGEPLVGSSYPADLTAVGETLFFVVSIVPTCLPLPLPYTAPEDCAVPRQELWRSDGTDAGTTRLMQLTTISDLVSVAGKLFFLGHDQTGAGLWQSDGTSAGTVQVALVGNNLASLTNVNGTLFFKVNFTDDDFAVYHLWRSDGTRTGTAQVDFFSLEGRTPLLSVNGKLFFAAYGDGGIGLWKADATTVTPVLITKDLPQELSSVQGQLYFTDETGALWTSNGTTGGTHRVKRINGSYRTAPAELQSSNGKLLFQANDGHNGSELWRSNGQGSGTYRVKDIRHGLPPSNPSELVSVNGTLFFRAKDGASGAELWKSDGTTRGTVLVKDIAPGTSSSYPTGLIKIRGTLFFNASDPASGRELWVSNGTGIGTKQIQDIAPGAASADPAEMTVVGPRVFFNANDGAHGRELWAIPLAVLGVSAADDTSE